MCLIGFSNFCYENKEKLRLRLPYMNSPANLNPAWTLFVLLPSPIHGGKMVAETSSADLNRFVIPTPCSREWAEMVGDDRKRFCDQCHKNVFNLATLSVSEIVDLIEGADSDRICGRLYRRNDGTFVRQPCETPIAGTPIWKFRFTIAHVLALMTFSASAFASIPWIGRKLEPIVNRWFAAPTPPSAVPGNWVEGEIMMMPEGSEWETTDAEISEMELS